MKNLSLLHEHGQNATRPLATVLLVLGGNALSLGNASSDGKENHTVIHLEYRSRTFRCSASSDYVVTFYNIEGSVLEKRSPTYTLVEETLNTTCAIMLIV